MDQKIQNLKDYIKSVKDNRPFCGTGVYTTLWYIKGLEKALSILEDELSEKIQDKSSSNRIRENSDKL